MLFRVVSRGTFMLIIEQLKCSISKQASKHSKVNQEQLICSTATHRKGFLPANRQFTISNRLELCSLLLVLLLIFSKLGIPFSFKSRTLGDMATPMPGKGQTIVQYQINLSSNTNNDTQFYVYSLFNILWHMERLKWPSKVLPSGIDFLGTQSTSMYTV